MDNAYHVSHELFYNTTHDTCSFLNHIARFDWSPTDPEIVSDILFAVANVMSYARTTYVMPSHELLGPLQISLGRMLGDITRFVVLFLLVSDGDNIDSSEESKLPWRSKRWAYSIIKPTHHGRYRCGIDAIYKLL